MDHDLIYLINKKIIVEMPSASPESRSRRRRRSHSRSKSRSPKTRKHSKDNKESNQASEKSKKRSHERHDTSPHHSKHKRSRETARRRSRSCEQSTGEKLRHRTPERDQGQQHQHPSRFEPVRVKEEPLSDDEERRRRRSRQRERPVSAIKRERENFFRSEAAAGSTLPETTEQPKDKPNFGLSGKLAEDTNVYNGVVIKYSEPVEARKPNKKWRLYPFKGDKPLPMLPIHRQSAYLLGRERRVADIPIDHPSCSKQHAVLQFRVIPYRREDGSNGRRIRPYIIDLESANGTFVNNKQIEPRRYVELMEKDVVKFGFSSREYVLLHEGSAGQEDDLDQPEEQQSTLPSQEQQQSTLPFQEEQQSTLPSLEN